MRREASALCALVLSCALASPVHADPDIAAAKNKKGGSRAIKSTEISKANVTVKVNGKKTKSKLFCYKHKAGMATKIKGGYSFATFKAMMKSQPSKKPLYSALNKAGQDICKSGDTTTPVGPLPDYLSMDKYTGPFGEEQARILFDRFGWSASPERIQKAVQDGLDKTITSLTTFVGEPNLDVIEKNMQCNGLLPDDPRNGTDNYKCDPLDPNDIDMGGLKSALLYRHWYTQNPFLDRMIFFIHDRFQSVNTRVLGGCRTWAVRDHINMLRKAGLTGDYVQFLRDFGQDYFGAIIWLHLLDSTNVAPNEDEAREILQLGGTGPYNLDGSPVYGDYDIAQNALALTGWSENREYRDINGYRKCIPTYSEQAHAQGPKRIFVGTSHERTVDGLDDVVDAIRDHPRLAENIAENIFDDFINPYATPAAIRQLAAIIEGNHHNLLETFKVVMASKAVYADKSRKSIPKQPLEILIGFLRITGLPIVYDYYALRDMADRLGQVDLSPNTVFGWRNRDALAGEALVLTRRNTLISLLGQNTDDLRDKKGYTYWDRFLQGLPSDGTASTQLVQRLQSWFNVRLNARQVATMVQYLDYDQHECNRYTQCAAGQKYYLQRKQFDPAVDSSDEGRMSDSYKTRGAIAMITMMPDFMMK